MKADPLTFSIIIIFLFHLNFVSFIDMTDMQENGDDILLYGKSGTSYQGKIYSDKNSMTAIKGSAIVCLSNSTPSGNEWHHYIRDIYDTADPQQALEHFKSRDDISHMILIPKESVAYEQEDKIDDLRRNYIHR